MFLSSSVFMVRINNFNQNNLRNFMFKEDDLFYSIFFYDSELEAGEIHWSLSFENGKMNLINFIRQDSVFFLFSSSIQNYVYLEKLLSRIIGEDTFLEIVKPPLYAKISKQPSQISSLSIDPHFGISATLNIDDKSIFLKVYTNGLITYTMSSDIKLVKEILKISYDLVEMCYEYDL